MTANTTTRCPVCMAEVPVSDDGCVAPHKDPNGFFPGECFGTGKKVDA